MSIIFKIKNRKSFTQTAIYKESTSFRDKTVRRRSRAKDRDVSFSIFLKLKDDTFFPIQVSLEPLVCMQVPNFWPCSGLNFRKLEFTKGCHNFP